MPERWTRVVLRFRVVVVASWVGVLVLGALSAGALPALLSNSLAVPGTDSERARTILRENFHEADDGTFTVVFRGSSRPSRAERRRLERRLADAAQAVPTARPGELRDGSMPFADIRTALSLPQAKTHTDDLRHALRASGGRPALVTGQPAIQHDLDPILASDLRRGELIAIVDRARSCWSLVLGLSPAVLDPVRRRRLHRSPPRWAPSTLLARDVSMVTYVTNLVELIGLALADRLLAARRRSAFARSSVGAAAG